ncbi:MAG: AAA family ATPase [Candidatus Melainabacteria bacterium]|nr:AAA family ATPase [Candidatus Melainabacteria bacterium]
MEIKPYLKSITLDIPEGKAAQSFPFSIPAIASFERMDFHPDVTFLVGENGSGKSTLLEAIASSMHLQGEGGTGNFIVEDRFGDAKLSNFVRGKKSFQKPRDRFFLRAESFFNIADYLEDLWRDPDARTSKYQVFKRYGGKSLHEQSHGESFLALLTHGLGGKGFYLFDEPEAALSPSRQLSALVRIDDLVKDQSQFIIATHSPILMAYPNATIYLFDNDGCRKIAYEETEHYKITRDFLNNYKRRLEQLLTDESNGDNDEYSDEDD